MIIILTIFCLIIIKCEIGAVQLLGEPIIECGFDLSNPNKNFFNDSAAKFEVAVKGTNTRGNIIIYKKE